VSQFGWKLPYGAELTVESGVKGTRFRVSAPGKSKVEVALAQSGKYNFFKMKNEGDGNFSCFLPDVGPGARYKFRLEGDLIVPDPYTRSQPDDVHGDSEVVDPTLYEWRDEQWNGLRLDEMIIYELHVGTFTPAGTFEAIIDHFDYLLDLGVNTIELLPIAEFPGKRNWGYDGVQYFAPDATYGGHEGLKKLIDRAHQLGIAVILDVVYNHFGPDGNYLWSYSRDYFSRQHKTPWGDAPNYDGEYAELMRSYILNNAQYWTNEFHVDGLRLDATFAMIDESNHHILNEIARKIHSDSKIQKTIIAEDHRNLASLHWPQPEGYDFDGQWADDFHHVLHCYFTQENEGYYENYKGNLEEIVKTLNEGFLYQGQRYATWKKPRGTKPERLTGKEFIVCIQNHDQIGNRALGERLNQLIERDKYHLAVALLLLSPFTPLLFMGQEYAAPQPFLFFTDHNEELGLAVTMGRRDEFKDFSSFADPKTLDNIPDPQAESTFLKSKIDLSDHLREPYAGTFRLHKTLLDLRRSKRALSLRNMSLSQTISPAKDVILMLRRSDRVGDEDFLCVANFSSNEVMLYLEQLKSKFNHRLLPDWRLPLLSTLAVDFGGSGALPSFQNTGGLILPANGLFLYALN
jgi:maltooligosyltrehalose trehalohydrolase